MPTYDYRCDDCGGFDALRALDARNDPASCPDCGRPSPRVLAAAPRLALLDSGSRSANAANERARHEPRRSSDYARLAHPAGCGCCASPGQRSATVRTPNGNKAFPGTRPWMISH